jgi:hypothetical protein
VKQAILTRLESDDEGTRGRLDVLHELTGEVVFSCVTLELPWRKNKRDRSCAPAGSYLFKGRADSPKHPGFVYEEWDDPATAEREDVKDRDNTQIHAANLAGDVDKGFVAQLLGCIAPGISFVKFRKGVKPAGDKDQIGVSASGSALKQLVAALNKETFHLTIKWAPDLAQMEAA